MLHSICRTLAFRATAFVVVAIGLNGAVWSQSKYPNQPIRMVVPYGPGGETDVFARAIAGSWLVFGQTIIVDNRAGATGIVGTEIVAGSKPDGYTLIFGTAATHALNLSAFKSLPYHPIRSFEPIAFVGSVPLVVLAHPSMPSTPKDFVALLKESSPILRTDRRYE